MSQDKFPFYKEHPKTCEPDDFWGQVKRTVNGQPVSQEQIDMIVDAVVSGLALDSDDTLLDLCCGNGALSTLLFSRCRGGLGVDFSEALISIANSYFESPPEQAYILQDVVMFCENPTTPDKFTKILCYGSFPFIEHDRSELLLRLLKDNFANAENVFIGNCPDKEQMSRFYGDQPVERGIENDPASPIGIWRTEKEFVEMAERCGWQAEIHKMPEKYYAAHYRYDVILSR
ncbi:MAG: class I SAM-dependent methyltransferase [Halobacteria archaeon]|nr:class I SAM-dependent methyltransferase [Halobacteria archaeon]